MPARWVSQFPAIARPPRPMPATAGHGRLRPPLTAILDARALWHWDRVDLTAGLSLERQKDDRQGHENYTGTGASPVLGACRAGCAATRPTADTREPMPRPTGPLADARQASAGVRSGRVRMRVADPLPGQWRRFRRAELPYPNPVAGLRWRPARPERCMRPPPRPVNRRRWASWPTGSDGASGFNTDLSADQPPDRAGRQSGARRALAGTPPCSHIATDDGSAWRPMRAGRSSFRNVGATRRWGLELGGAWRMQPGLQRADGAVAAACVLPGRLSHPAPACPAR